MPGKIALPTRTHLLSVVRMALREDIKTVGDITTNATIPDTQKSIAHIIAKEGGIIAGQMVASAVFNEVNEKILYTMFKNDGEWVKKGDIVSEIQGYSRGILTAERTALNFLAKLSGIATCTNKFVKEIENTGARILDTRKTTPGLRLLEKYAVRVGGGHNHRFGLFDMVLIKENHVRACGTIAKAVDRCKKAVAKENIKIEVEATNYREVQEAVEAGVDRIMLDNMAVEEMKRSVDYIGGRAEVEASGNVSLDTISAIAQTGVDYISIGKITHSAPALDLSLIFI